MNRRGFLASALGFLAAPPIVRATSIMPVSVMAPDLFTCIEHVGPTFFDPRGLFGSYADSKHQWFLLPTGPTLEERFSNDSPISRVGVENHFRKRRWDGKPISLA